MSLTSSVAERASIENALAALDPIRPVIDQLSDRGQHLVDIAGELAAGPNEKRQTELRQAQSNAIEQMLDLFRKTEASEVLGACREFQARLATMSDVPDGSRYESLVSASKAFAQAYDLTLRYQNARNAMNVSVAARQLSVASAVASDIASAFSAHLYSGQRLEASGFLHLVLADSDHAKEVIERLDAILDMYRILADLFGVSDEDDPLRVLSVESGSLFLDLIGNALLLGLIGTAIKTVAPLVFRRWTRDGRIETLPNEAKALEAVLDLEKRLREAGRDTSVIQQNIHSAVESLAGRVVQLLQRTNAVRVNGEEVTEPVERKQLTARKYMRLLNPAPPPAGDA